MDTKLYDLFYSLEDSHWWFQGRKDLVLSLAERYRPRFQPRILDVGCGTGGMLAHFSRLGPSIGLDMARESAYYCGKRSLEMVLGSGIALPFRTGSFDIVAALDVIEHVDEDQALLHEMQRVLAPGGVLLLTVPAFQFLWSSHDDLNHHRRRYVRQGLACQINAAGFTPLKLSYYNSLLLPAAVVRKYVLKVRSNGTACHLEQLPAPLNTIFRRILSMEKPVLARTQLPLGASIICAARRRD